MSNTLGTLSGSLVLQRVLELVFTMRPILNRITFSAVDPFSGSREAKLNQTVYARTIAIPTVGNFGDAAAAVTTTDVPVTISAHKQVFHTFTLAEYNATDRRLVDEAAMPMAVAMANQMVDAIAALWVKASFPGPTQENIFSVANSDYDALIAVRKSLIDRGVPAGLPKFGAVSTGVYATMLADPRLTEADKNPTGDMSIRTGVIRNVLDFDIFEYPALPTGENLQGFFGTPDSTVLAVRVPSNPEEVLGQGVKFPGNLGYITEPRTGLTVMAEQWIDADTLAANTRLHWMYGCAKGNANNGQRLVTASTT